MHAAARGCAVGLFVVVAVATAFCHSARADDKIKVFVGIVPYAYFVERIGGDRVEVGVLVGPGREPHEYDPTSKEIAALASARLLFTVGMPFERALVKKIGASFKNLTVVDTTKGIPLREMTEEETEAEVHNHKPGKGHEHGKKTGHSHRKEAADPHVWLDPVLAKTQAATICEALAAIDPAHAEDYRENLAAFQQDLDRLDAKLSEALTPLKGKAFYVYHPAFGYFADRYGLKQVPVETGGKEPGARHLAQLITRARKEGVKVIFVQPQFSAKTAQALAKEIDGAVVPLDDLAKDYLKNMEDIAAKISAAIRRLEKQTDREPNN
ncbi:MAG: zinc ABC transporter substrate-binding protein [Desulfomonile sp.]|nr:zinc ABC transporter substrate-binding protein [Desulfomonile sp.]